MKRFVVYRNSRGSKAEIPYVVDVQSEGVDTGSRVVVPLIPLKRFGPAMTRLNPVLEVDGLPYVFAAGDIAAIPARDLKQAVDDFSRHRAVLVSALDFLFQGY